MAPPTLHPIKLPGPWSEGFVLERQHTLSSTLIGHDSNGNPQFDTKRSELGELVYRLKNRSDRKALAPIAEAAVEIHQGLGTQSGHDRAGAPPLESALISRWSRSQARSRDCFLFVLI